MGRLGFWGAPLENYRDFTVATKQDIVDYIVDQVCAAGRIETRKMFGEYALYCDHKVVALICDNQLFVKPTTGGQNFIGKIVFGSPYPGAKPWFLITGDLWDDSEWLSELIRVTARELSLPKPKKLRKK